MSGSAYALSRRAALLLRSRTMGAGEGEEAGEFLGETGAETSGGEAESSGRSSSGSGSSSGSSSGSGSSGGSSRSGILSGPLGGLRPTACEDCAVGLWLLAHDVRHGEDLRMCRYDHEVEVEGEGEGEEVHVEAAAVAAAGSAGGGEPPAEKKKRKRHSCARPGGSPEALQAPVVITNRCNGLCDPATSLVDLHGDPACRAPTLGAEEAGEEPSSAAAAAGGALVPSAAAAAGPALPLGDFWASNRGLSHADAVNLECIKVTAEGNVDKSACKEERGGAGG